jgi:hypothetical protein
MLLKTNGKNTFSMAPEFGGASAVTSTTAALELNKPRENESLGENKKRCGNKRVFH